MQEIRKSGSMSGGGRHLLDLNTLLALF